MTRVAVCGGTSLAHAVAAVLGAAQHQVTVLTRQPGRWSTQVRAIYLDLAEVIGAVRATDDPEEAMSGVEYAFICVPMVGRRTTLQAIAPFAPPGCWLGGIPGFGGFDWEARAILGADAQIFGLQRVPYVRRTISYGETVWISGIRPRLFVAALPSTQAPELARRLEALLNIPVSPLSSYLAVSLSASNAIFHPARLLGAFGDLSPGERVRERRQFYEDWDDASSKAYLRLDEDVQRLARAFGVPSSETVPIHKHFGSNSAAELTARIRSIRALRDRPLPLRGPEGEFELDLQSFYFTEDACFNLPVLRALADIADEPTPWLDQALSWTASWTGRHFLKEGRLNGPAAVGLPRP